MSTLFGPIHQLGYVVQDIDAAMNYWTQNMRIGPFYYLRQASILESSYHGVPNDLQISVALSYSGDMQILLIQPLNEAPSSFREFLNGGHSGLHHVGFFSDCFELDLQRAAEAGLEVIQNSLIGDPGAKLAVLGPNGDALTRPALIDLHAANLDLFQMVKKEARRWDGSGPVRRLGD